MEDNEIKAKVFASYLGQKCLFQQAPDSSGFQYPPQETIIGVGAVDLYNEEKEYNGNEWKVILKPLSEISDEDIVEISKIMDSEYEAQEAIKYKEQLVGSLLNPIYNGSEAAPIKILELYQYLQSRGYDLPHFLLGGKTLHEAGLAIYKHEGITS